MKKKLTLVIVQERDMTELYLLKSDLEKSHAISEGYRSQLKQLTTQDGHWSKANIRSAMMYKVMEKAVRLSQVDTTILLQGEAGVGKGYFANLIEQLVVLLPGDKVDIEDIPSHIRTGYNKSKNTRLTQGWNLQETVTEIEKDLITRAIENFGSQRKAAEPLGIDHSTLSIKIKKYRL